MTMIIRDFSRWLHGHLMYISVALIATLMSLFTDEMNRFFKRLTKGAHFVVRFSVYVIVRAFAYGMLTIWGASILTRMLGRVESILLPFIVIASFLLLGLVAERKNHI